MFFHTLLPLLLLFLIALLFILRMLLAQRVPKWLRFVEIKDPRLPPAWADAFAEIDAEMRALGFEPAFWCRVQYVPDAPVIPRLARFYRHREQAIFARVSPPQLFLSPERCMTSLFSLAADGALLGTVQRIPMLFPMPPESMVRGTVHGSDTPAGLWAEHQRLLEGETAPLQECRETDRILELTNGFEERIIRWYRERGLVRPHPEGGYVPRLRPVLGFLGRFFRGRERDARPERRRLSPQEAALLYAQWRKSQRLAPTPWTQRMLLLFTGALFLLSAGLYWSWPAAIALLLTLLLHEGGHLLAMRWLGYHNTQILLLPLLGGVATGVEQHPSAANRAFVSLMGPLPGILLGWLLLYLAAGPPGAYLLPSLALVLLVVNYFNLLPTPPLDGGQLVRALIPPRWLNLVALFELAGALALFWIGLRIHWIIALIGLIPLFAAIGLWMQRRVLHELHQLWDTERPATESARVAQVIEVYDRHREEYAPLAKKAKKVQGLLENLELKPAAPLTRNLLLGLYLALFAIPLAVIPGFAGQIASLFQNVEPSPTAFETELEAARSLGWEGLLRGLDEQERAAFARHRERRAPEKPPALASLLQPPADPAVAAAAESRLGVALPPDYRSFLDHSNGLLDPWEPDNPHWLLPADRLARFGEVQPQIIAELRRLQQDQQSEGHQPGIWVSPGVDFAAPSVLLDAQALQRRILIGQGGLYGGYLLLRADSGAQGPGVVELSDDLMATGYPNFRSFVEARYATLRLYPP